MARWLTFDRNTASTLRKQLPREQVFEHGAGSAVEYASDSNRDLVTLLPTGSSGEVAIAVFRQPSSKAAAAPKPVLVEKPAPPSAWKVVTPAPVTPTKSIEPKVDTSAVPKQTPLRPQAGLPFVRQKPPLTRAGGILGTRDEVVFEEEEPVEKPKRNWWQRFWEEDE
jgi:hypothetical protein